MTNIDPKLAADCLLLGKFPLSHLLLMQDANYPWFILVPDRVNIQEIYQLPAEDQRQLLYESSLLGESLMKGFMGDKLNIAALGNVVPQLHLHHIVRYQSDPAWPAPVWGKVPVRPYDADLLEQVIGILKQVLREEIVYRV
ncbi:MAG: HIT domain-containing protein [Thiohalophilus sp.]